MAGCRSLTTGGTHLIGHVIEEVEAARADSRLAMRRMMRRRSVGVRSGELGSPQNAIGRPTLRLPAGCTPAGICHKQQSRIDKATNVLSSCNRWQPVTASCSAGWPAGCPKHIYTSGSRADTFSIVELSAPHRFVAQNEALTSGGALGFRVSKNLLRKGGKAAMQHLLVVHPMVAQGTTKLAVIYRSAVHAARDREMLGSQNPQPPQLGSSTLTRWCAFEGRQRT